LFRDLLVVKRRAEDIPMDEFPAGLLNTLLQVLICHVVLQAEKQAAGTYYLTFGVQYCAVPGRKARPKNTKGHNFMKAQ
jgi:hypothetical protein